MNNNCFFESEIFPQKDKSQNNKEIYLIFRELHTKTCKTNKQKKTEDDKNVYK